MSCLTAWGPPQIGLPKKVQKRPLNKQYGFYPEKDLKSKNVKGKKVYILAKDVNTERKFKSKPKSWARKRPDITAPQIRQLKLNCFIVFYKMLILNKIFTP